MNQNINVNGAKWGELIYFERTFEYIKICMSDELFSIKKATYD